MFKQKIIPNMTDVQNFIQNIFHDLPQIYLILGSKIAFKIAQHGEATPEVLLDRGI